MYHHMSVAGVPAVTSSRSTTPVPSSATVGLSSQRLSANYGIPVHITLTSNDATSPDRRTLTLVPDQTIIIGRSSRSGVKTLQAAPDNAFFDCPVISRSHAELKITSSDSRGSQVTIKDPASLHGTFVNGTRLATGRDFVLASGDVLKLGNRVTRGDDIHEGVSLTFALTDEPSLPLPNVITGGRFQVPSDDDVSDLDDSDDESTHSSGGKAPSSVMTTPEQYRTKPGSQQQPINIDLLPAQPQRVIVLDAEEDDFVEMPGGSNTRQPAQPAMALDNLEKDFVPESITRQDTASLFHDTDNADSDNDLEPESIPFNTTSLSQILSSRNHIASSEPDEESLVDESEDEDTNYPDAQSSDVFSDSCESDAANDAISEPDSNPADEEAWTVNRPVSPELNHRSLEQNPPYEAPIANGNVPSHTKPRYDPVRNSQPPEQAPASMTPALAEPPWLASDQYEHPFGVHSTTTNPPIDPLAPNLWNFEIFAPAFPCEDKRTPFYMSPPLHSLPPHKPWGVTSNGLNHPSYPPPASFPPPVGVDSCPQPLPTPMVGPSGTQAPKHKISITDIVEKPTQVSPEPQSIGDLPESMNVADSIATPPLASHGKRKADVLDADESTVSTEQPAKKIKPVVETARARLPRKSAGRSVTRRVASSVAHLATGAVVGMGAMVAFLNSDKAQQLIDWLA